MIVVEQVEFAYGNLPVLRGVDLRIRPGEVVFLLGPNGVGKTTLVELLLGLLSPDSGTIRVLGVDPGKADAGFWGRIGLVTPGGGCVTSSNGCAPFRPHQGGPAQPWLKCCAWSVWRTRPRFGSDGSREVSAGPST